MDREKVIKGLESLRTRLLDVAMQDRIFALDVSMVTNAIELLKEQEPKTPIHIHEEYPEHDWRTDEDGKIDEWAMEDDIHHGPSCKRCGYNFCVHCSPNGWEKPCVIDYYKCPKCGTRIFKCGRETMYCKSCGQAVKWNE